MIANHTLDARWRERAACRDTDPDVFFPAAVTGPVYEAQVATAKAVCRGCRVRSPCLTHALATVPVGVAGGLDEYERRALRRARGQGEPVTVFGPATLREKALGLLARGVSVAEVAGQCGVSSRTVDRWAAADRAAQGTAGRVSRDVCRAVAS